MPRSRVRKKPAKSRRPETAFVLGAEDLGVLARSMRRSCTECGSDHLHWGDLAGGVFGARTDEQRAHFTEAVSVGLSTRAPAWWCMDCSGIGVFADMV